jgi:hypothetical protein
LREFISAAGIVVIGWLAAVSLSACSSAEPAVRPEQPPSSLAPGSPDISGLGFVGEEDLLAVHDAKGGSDRARVSRVYLPDTEAVLHTDTVPVEAGDRQWPGTDLESIASSPGTSLTLLAESGGGRSDGEPVPRIFLAEYRRGQLFILDATNWPVPVDNVEGTAVTSAAGNLVFLYAERASAVDPGNGGPFRSTVWRIGRLHADYHGQPLLSLESRPRRLAMVDRLKVEGLAVRRIAGKTQIVIGSDDESYGGVIRPLPH